MNVTIFIKRCFNHWKAECVTAVTGHKFTTVGLGNTPHESIGDLMVSLNRDDRKVCISDIRYNQTDFWTVKYCAEIGVNSAKPV